MSDNMSSSSMAAGDPWNFPSTTIPSSIYAAGAGIQSTWTTGELDLPANKDFKELAERISAIEEQMMILRPDIAMQEKYPALKESYDAYQVILKLVKDNGKTQK